MKVRKRSGNLVPVSFDAIIDRLDSLRQGLAPEVDVAKVAAKVCSSVHDGISTEKLDVLTAETAVALGPEHPDYTSLAARILVSNLHKNTSDSILQTFENMNEVLTDAFLATIRAHHQELQTFIDYTRDFKFDFFGFRTLERLYLTRVSGQIVERPQHLYLRVGVALHGDNLDKVRETYEYLSQHIFTHASPTLFNAGTKGGNLSSCYLLDTTDSLEGLFGTLQDCAKISKAGGGIGLAISNVRGQGARIHGTNGSSNGLPPMIRTFNEMVKWIDQGGRRRGALALYLEPHHPDILEFLDIRRNSGDESLKAREIFTALWISDLFMERVRRGEQWSLFDPSQCPGLDTCWGTEYVTLFEQYEQDGKAVRTLPARDVWFAALTSQVETGTPYILYKDSCNRKSNQQHLGTIKCSNLCVAPETLVLTKNGYKRIHTLCDTSVEVWNGEEWSAVTVRRTNENAELLQVDIRVDGQESNTDHYLLAHLNCTPYHIFYLKSGEKKTASQLEPGDALLGWKDKRGIWHRDTVHSVVHTGRRDATYCFTEPKRQMGVFNGILTGNCTEIVEYTSPEEVAVCNLLSLSLPAFVKKETSTFDYDALAEATRIATINLNRVIDTTVYPIPQAKYSNLKHRPLGLGVQGLQEVFYALRLPFDSPGAAHVNRHIFETIYFAALSASCELARVDGAHASFEGSPASKGILQYDMWEGCVPETTHYDWEGLKSRIRTHGLRNSLLVAPMPTASTSQIFGNTESFEAAQSNIFVRRTLAGEFIVVNQSLCADLRALGLWTKDIRDMIMRDGGSIQGIPGIPDDIKALYKVAWELPMRVLIDLATSRAPFICQSQSLNLYVAEPSFKKLSRYVKMKI
jgi:ribonucleotide reductase alpha subunit